MRAAPRKDISDAICKLGAGQSKIFMWPSDRTRDQFYNAVHKMIGRLRSKGAISRAKVVDEGMQVTRDNESPVIRGNAKGEVRLKLESMSRGEVWVVELIGDEDERRRQKLRVMRTRADAQRATGWVWRINVFPDSLKIKRRA